MKAGRRHRQVGVFWKEQRALIFTQKEKVSCPLQASMIVLLLAWKVLDLTHTTHRQALGKGGTGVTADRARGSLSHAPLSLTPISLSLSHPKSFSLPLSRSYPPLSLYIFIFLATPQPHPPMEHMGWHWRGSWKRTWGGGGHEMGGMGLEEEDMVWRTWD